MGGYTTYNEKRIWRNTLNDNTVDMRNDKSMIMDISDFDNMTTMEKQDFLRRYCCRSPNRLNHHVANRHNKQQSETHGKLKQTIGGTAQITNKSSPNHHKMELKRYDTLNGNWHASQDESCSTDMDWGHHKNIPKQPSSTVLENLKHLFKGEGQDGKDLKFIIIEDGKNSKRYERSTPSEDKSVQADWTMVVEMREASNNNNNLLDLHSSTPNLFEEKKRPENIRQVRKSVSDSEEDEDRHNRIITKTQKVLDASRQREDNLIAHLRDYRGRMEQLHRKITLRDSNMERLEAEISRLKEVLVEYRGKEKEMQSLINDLQLNISDQEAQFDEDMTLCQLREAELKRAIDDLQVANKRLKTENSHLNIELMHRPNKRTQDEKHSSMEGSNEQAPPLHNRQSRSFDALSSTANSPGNQDHHPSPSSYQTAKPTDQKVFLNGRIIMSHSTNLQQVLRMHANLFNITKSKSETPERFGAEDRSRSRTREESAEHHERENSISKNQKTSETATHVNSIQKPSKQEVQGRISPYQKNSSPKVQHIHDSHLEQNHHHHQQLQHHHHNQPSLQHHHHHHQQSQQHHPKHTKHMNHQTKPSHNQGKLETRT